MKRAKDICGGNHCQVPDSVIAAVCDAIGDCDAHDAEFEQVQAFRKLITAKLAKRMDFAFCSDYRHEVTPVHRLIHSIISTVEANHLAGKI